MQKIFSGTLVIAGFFYATFAHNAALCADVVSLEAGIDDTMLVLLAVQEHETKKIADSGGGFNPWEPSPKEPSWPSDGSSGGNWWDDSGDGNPFDPWPSTGTYGSKKSGAADIISAEILYQTLRYYGVKHVIRKENGRFRFKVLQSTRSYFKNLTEVDVSLAIKEMSQYLVGHMCNEPTPENVYKLFVQVPPSKVGLRFMYDMAWALLGNSLPKDPNQIFSLNSKWKVLADIIRETGPILENKNLMSISRTISSVLSSLYKLGKLVCFVDVTPDPRYEYVKRNAVNKLLKLQKEFDERAEAYKDILDNVESKGNELKLTQLRELLKEN